MCAAGETMATQADVIGFDEAGSVTAQEWLQLLHIQASRDPPKELFSLFHKTTTVLCPHHPITTAKPWTMSSETNGRHLGVKPVSPPPIAQLTMISVHPRSSL